VVTGASDVTLTIPVYSSNYNDIIYTQNGISYSLKIGKMYTFKKVDAGAGFMIISPSGGATIDGAATLSTKTRWQSFTIQYNGSNYFIISNY
jgi:hypothetical protein